MSQSILGREIRKLNKFYDQDWKLDWVGEWFPIMRSLGEFTDIVYLKCSSSGAVEEVFYLDHGQYDGVGGFQVLLEKQQCPGASYRTQSDARPGFFKQVLGFLKYFLESRASSVNWKKRDHAIPGKKIAPLVQVFSLEQTRQLTAQARAKKVTLTSLILHALDASVRSLLQNEQKENRWLIPVNMRAGVTRTNPHSNHASYLSVTLNPKTDVVIVGKKLKSALGMGYHWAAWWGILLGRTIGLNGMHKILKKYHDKKHSWAGTLSNLGVWSHANTSQTWGFCPPVSKSHPVAVGLVTWNGQLSMAIQLHPSLNFDTDQTTNLMQMLSHALLG